MESQNIQDMHLDTECMPERDYCIEFGDEEDDFLNARQKSPEYWILKHLTYGKNKFIIGFWMAFVIGSTLTTSLISVKIGEAVEAFSEGNGSQLTYYFFYILIVGLISAICHLSGNILREFLAQRMERDVRDEFYLNLLGKSLSFHDQQQIGDLMARATSDVRQLNYLISPAVGLIFDSLISLIIPTVFIASLFPPQLLIVPFIFISAFLYSLLRYFHNLGPVTRQMRKSFGEMNSHLNEAITGIEVIKGLTLESLEKNKIINKAKIFRDATVQEGKIQARYIPLLLIAITITSGLFHSLLVYIEQGINLGQVISYVGLLINYRRPTRLSLWTFSIVRKAISAAERLIETMNEKGTIGQNTEGLERSIKGSVEYQNVCFQYPRSNNPVLKNISFKTEPGQTIAIVGATGSGKTTLTKLVSRLYDTTEGRIFLDGEDVRKYSLAALRNQISYIEQDVFLFEMSIFDNISFGRTSSKEEVIKVAKDAQAHGFIKELSQGYDTKIGEEGVQLSGGQAQRIAIARAFLSDPKILVLDDSTSAIDSKTEDRIQKAIKNILKDRTTFIITHRLSQIRWADEILVLKKGQIDAVGDHYSLLKESEEYRKIFVKKFDRDLNQLLEEEH